jgi:hypothetical protein
LAFEELVQNLTKHSNGLHSLPQLTSGVFQRLMAQAFPKIDVLDVGRLLLNYVLSDPYVDVALVGGHEACLSEPRFVELNNGISDDVASRIDGCEAHLGDAARSVCPLGKRVRSSSLLKE